MRSLMQRSWRAWLSVPLAAVLWAGCASAGDEGGETQPSEAPLPRVGAEGVQLTKVSIYQSVERVVMQDGAPVDSSVPLVAGRHGLLRAFYSADEGVVGSELRGQLRVAGHPPVYSTTTAVAASFDGDLGTTVNFDLRADMLDSQLDFHVSIMPADSGSSAADGSGNPAALYPPDLSDSSHPIEVPQNTFRIVMVPFAYNADGSGRVPDLTPEAAEVYRQRFLTLYPVSNVELSVHEPVQWDNPIGNDGSGWEAVGLELFSLRRNEVGEDLRDVYYYGIFNPTDTFGQFCGGGCLLGVTLLNDSPPDTGSPDLRLGLGVGYPDYGPDTAVHEIGHAHGREHAPCGPGLDPNSIDFAYPHGNGSIGLWGYDILTGALKDPAVYSDYMGYCNQQWTSDYTFAAMASRGAAVNAPRRLGGRQATVPTRMIRITPDGASAGPELTTALDFRRGHPITLELEDGQQQPSYGHYYRFDHLPGGWLMVPNTRPFRSLTTQLDGRSHTIELRR